MGLKGDPRRLTTFAQKLRALPVTLAAEVATDAAPAMTELTQQAYSSGRNVYGDARPLGVDGQALTLRASGDTERDVRFVHVGTIIRCVLSEKYQRFLIGKYRILPMGAPPTAWRARLDQILHSKQGPVL